MEHYEKKISFLGENIQTIRKHRGMKQQELADKIGINMQSLSKIERGVNYPTFDTFENEFFDDEKECTFYKAYKLIQYIHNYITNEVTELEELMEIKQLIQRQKLERMIKVHKEMRGLDRYREQPKEYKYHDPYDDWIFRQLADIDNRNNIPDTSPQVDFNEADYEDYLKAKWNRGL